MARVQVPRVERKYVNRGVEIDLPAAYDELEENSVANVCSKRLLPIQRREQTGTWATISR